MAFGDKPRDACRTPPYFTAEPVVSTTRDVRKGDFVVFATDGLWDCLTSEEVVGLVGRWLEDRGADATVVDEDGRTHIVRVPLDVDPPLESNRSFKSTTTAAITTAKDTTAFKTYLPSELPVLYPPGYEDKTTMYKWWRAEKKFICEDELVAVHLMRNALGGANKDLGLALLEIPMPRARKYRCVIL
jgi:pyruvate dehydrogenase phosphatase